MLVLVQSAALMLLEMRATRSLLEFLRADDAALVQLVTSAQARLQRRMEEQREAEAAALAILRNRLRSRQDPNSASYYIPSQREQELYRVLEQANAGSGSTPGATAAPPAAVHEQRPVGHQPWLPAASPQPGQVPQQPSDRPASDHAGSDAGGDGVQQQAQGVHATHAGEAPGCVAASLAMSGTGSGAEAAVWPAPATPSPSWRPAAVPTAPSGPQSTHPQASSAAGQDNLRTSAVQVANANALASQASAVLSRAKHVSDLLWAFSSLNTWHCE